MSCGWSRALESWLLFVALARHTCSGFVIYQPGFSTAPRPPTAAAHLRRVTRVNMLGTENTPPDLQVESRAAFLRGSFAAAAALSTVVAVPKEAPAIELGPLRLPFVSQGKDVPPEQAKVVEVAKYTRVVDKLEEDLRVGALKGGDEDSAVVSKVLETYLKPMQASMMEVTPAVQMQLSGKTNRERSGLLPLLMKGHLLELEQACGSKVAKEQLKEVEEVKETLDEFVTLAKTQYDFQIPADKGSPNGDQLGIFGCKFYGMKRTDGTNTCQPDP